MTLHQAHVPNSTIKIIGRWRSDAFLIYLQGQVATFTKGGLQGHGGGTLFHSPGAQPMPCLSPQRILLKPTRTYSCGSSCPFQHFFFFSLLSLLGYLLLRHVGSLLTAAGP